MKHFNWSHNYGMDIHTNHLSLQTFQFPQDVLPEYDNTHTITFYTTTIIITKPIERE